MAFNVGQLITRQVMAICGLGRPISRQIHCMTGFNPSSRTQIMPAAMQNAQSQCLDAASPYMIAGGAWSLITSRFWRRVENDKEQKRLKKHSWKVRVATKKGQIMIMKRMLKGRFYLSH